MKSTMRKVLFIGCVLAATGLLVSRAAQNVFSANPYMKTVNSVQKAKGVTVEFRSVLIEGATVRMSFCYSLPPTKTGVDYGLKDVSVSLDGQKLAADQVLMADLKQWIYKDDKDVISGDESTTVEGSKKWLSKGLPSKRCDDLSFDMKSSTRPSKISLTVGGYGSSGPSEDATCDDLRAKLKIQKLSFDLICHFKTGERGWEYVNLPSTMTAAEARILGNKALTDYTEGPWTFEANLN